MVRKKRAQATMASVLEYIKRQKNPVTTKEIAEYLHVHRQTIYTYLRPLIHEQCVKAVPYKGRGNAYIYLSDPTKKELAGKPSTKVVASERTVLTMDLSPEQLAGLLSKWAKEPWRPKAFTAARYLPLGLARLYELAAEASYGAYIAQIDIDEVRVNLDEFRKETEQLLRVVNGMLQIAELWDSGTFAAYLIEGGPVDLLKLQAFDAKQIN